MSNKEEYKLADLKFLVVDDSVTMRRILINSLNKLGYEDIIEAGDGKDALAKLYSEPGVNFIITDWNMPNMDGLTFVKSIKEDSNLASIPILMVTTRSLKEDILDAMKVGVNNYIVKPFTPQVLSDKIEAVLNK